MFRAFWDQVGADVECFDCGSLTTAEANAETATDAVFTFDTVDANSSCRSCSVAAEVRWD